MKREIKKIVLEVITELMAGGSSVDGAASFRGGPYGIGAKAQLAGPLDPSVQAIEDMEQNELGQNIEDQHWNMGKYRNVPGEPFQDINGKPKHQRDFRSIEEEEEPTNGHDLLDERNDADMFYTHLPGFPAPNAIESPVQHVPDENMVSGDLRSGYTDGTETFLIDDIIDELEGPGNVLNMRKESYMGRNYPGDQSQPSKPPGYDIADENPEDPQIGHMSQQGADSSIIGGYGAIMAPKKFVPDEQPQMSSIIDHDMDGIEDRLDKNQPPELTQRVKEGKDMEEAKRAKKVSFRHKDRYGVKPPSDAQIAKKFKEARRAIVYLGQVLGDETHEEIMDMIHRLRGMETHYIDPVEMDEAAVEEEYKSKAQQGYFHAKAAEGDPEFKKLAHEFDSETSPEEFKNLPSRAHHNKTKKESLTSEAIKKLVKEEFLRQLKR